MKRRMGRYSATSKESPAAEAFARRSSACGYGKGARDERRKGNEHRLTSFVIALLIALPVAASARERDTTFRDRSGNIVGISRVDSQGTTVFRDRSLNVTGTATANPQGGVTFRDRGGFVESPTPR